jgi:hypothetical protein
VARTVQNTGVMKTPSNLQAHATALFSRERRRQRLMEFLKSFDGDPRLTGSPLLGVAPVPKPMPVNSSARNASQP